MGSLALATGAASGPGLEFVRLLAGGSHDLVLADSNEKGLEEVKRTMVSSHGVDVEDFFQGLTGLIRRIRERLRR